MTHNPSNDPDRQPTAGMSGLWSRRSRRERIRSEIEANRRGEYLVPTWVLAAALALMIAGILALVVWANQA